jgi:Uncharacterised ACR, YggU family COG1872
VRVVEPADEGRATNAALEAVAKALGLPRRSVSLVRGATSRRKLVEVGVGTSGPMLSKAPWRIYVVVDPAESIHPRLT